MLLPADESLAGAVETEVGPQVGVGHERVNLEHSDLLIRTGFRLADHVFHQRLKRLARALIRRCKGRKGKS